MSQVTIIGVDCATQPNKTGLALGRIEGNRVAVQEARCASSNTPAASIICDWAQGQQRVLLALDAPLGWPRALARELAGHIAGESLEETPDAMFHRLTDDDVRKRIPGIYPFEVGANLIARTAHAALSLLATLRRELSEDIPLAWNDRWEGRIAAIEVYPAATRRAHQALEGTVKLEGLGHLFSSDVAALSESPDAQDAILCVLAGADFLKSFAKPPAAKQKNRALHEGWIWVPTPPMLLERYKGSLLGLACGDAVGTSVEFRPRGSFPPVTDMAGGGPFRLAPGQWTDDTSMALCLAQSLIESKGFDARDQMNRYLRWWRTGYLSSTGRCFDIGNTTRAALANFEATGEPFSGSTAPDTAGNGSLMRLAPVVLYFFPDAERVTQFSAESSRTTHAASEAVECCVLLGHMIAVALSGAPKEVILAAQGVALQNSTVISLQRGDYSTKPTEKIRGSGYCIESLEAALWCFQHTDGFEAAVLRAVNLGDDADTTAAIVGQLAGAFYGVQGIPQHWLERLHMRKEIETLAARLYEALPKCDCAKPHVAPALPEE